MSDSDLEFDSDFNDDDADLSSFESDTTEDDDLSNIAQKIDDDNVSDIGNIVDSTDEVDDIENVELVIDGVDIETESGLITHDEHLEIDEIPLNDDNAKTENVDNISEFVKMTKVQDEEFLCNSCFLIKDRKMLSPDSTPDNLLCIYCA